MNSRYEQIFIGIIVLLIGIIFFVQGNVVLNFGSISLVVLGFAFSLLYKTKRKSWSLILGAFLMYLGISGILVDNFSHFDILKTTLDGVIFSMSFLFVGLSFITLYFNKNKNGLLIPGALITAYGINNLIKLFIPFMSGISFYLCIGLGFLYIYKEGRYFLGRWPLYAFFIFMVLILSRIGFLFAAK